MIDKIISTREFTDEEGKKIERIYQSGISDILLVEPSQSYIDGVLKRTHDEVKIADAKQEYKQRRAARINLLGDARSKDPDRVAEEDRVMDMLTSAINTTELNHISSMLEMFGDKTLAQLNQYFNNHSRTAADFKQLVKKMFFGLWGTLNLVRILANRELPPE
jgi:hypothetical protein